MPPRALPDGACDCHLHVFGPQARFAFAPDRAYTPPDALFETYREAVLDRLDLTRDPNPHLGFGFATHFCMGAPLARLEAEVAFRALATRLPGLALENEEPEYRPSPILRGLTRLPLTFDPA